MAFRSNRPISLVLPPFRGVTRRIILIAICVYFGSALLGLFSRDLQGTLHTILVLRPDQSLHRLVWELLTYAFVGQGLFSVGFALLSIWFFGSALEDERGPLWMSEYFLLTTIGGAVIASLLSNIAAAHRPGLIYGPASSGLWPAVLAVLVAYAYSHAEEQVQFNFIFSLKAKYLAAIYLLVYVGLALVGDDRLGALLALASALVGYMFLRLAPRRGFRMRLGEKWLKLKASYYRAKRRRAAKKFTVYMREQGREVNVDEDGRYVDPDARLGSAHRQRDPDDRRWMN